MYLSCVVYSFAVVDCNTPPTINDGSRIVTTTTYQSTATYSCNNGYIMSGSPTVTCLASGSWSPTPTCTGTYIDGYIYSSQKLTLLSYSFFLSLLPPHTPIYCCHSYSQGKLMFHYVIVYLIITVVDCGSPPAIDNGSPGTSTSTTFGGTVTYTCDNGFTLSGSAMITCLATGMWDTPPSCTGEWP